MASAPADGRNAGAAAPTRPRPPPPRLRRPTSAPPPASGDACRSYPGRRAPGRPGRSPGRRRCPRWWRRSCSRWRWARRGRSARRRRRCRRSTRRRAAGGAAVAAADGPAVTAAGGAGDGHGEGHLVREAGVVGHLHGHRVVAVGHARLRGVGVAPVGATDPGPLTRVKVRPAWVSASLAERPGSRCRRGPRSGGRGRPCAGPTALTPRIAVRLAVPPSPSSTVRVTVY